MRMNQARNQPVGRPILGQQAFVQVPPRVQFQRPEQAPLRMQIPQVAQRGVYRQNMNHEGPVFRGAQFQPAQRGNQNFLRVDNAGHRVNQQGPQPNVGGRQLN